MTRPGPSTLHDWQLLAERHHVPKPIGSRTRSDWLDAYADHVETHVAAGTLAEVDERVARIGAFGLFAARSVLTHPHGPDRPGAGLAALLACSRGRKTLTPDDAGAWLVRCIEAELVHSGTCGPAVAAQRWLRTPLADLLPLFRAGWADLSNASAGVALCPAPRPAPPTPLCPVPGAEPATEETGHRTPRNPDTQDTEETEAAAAAAPLALHATGTETPADPVRKAPPLSAPTPPVNFDPRRFDDAWHRLKLANTAGRLADVSHADFLAGAAGAHRENAPKQRDTETHEGTHAVNRDGTGYRSVAWHLVRVLKACPAFAADAEWEARDRFAAGFLRLTGADAFGDDAAAWLDVDPIDLETDFAACWSRVRVPWGVDPMAAAHRLAVAHPLPLPPRSGAEGKPPYTTFVSLCGWLQTLRPAGSPILLPGRKVAATLGCNRKTPCTWIKWAERHGYLALARAGDQRPGGRAAEYRFAVAGFPSLEAAMPGARRRGTEEEPEA